MSIKKLRTHCCVVVATLAMTAVNVTSGTAQVEGDTSSTKSTSTLSVGAFVGWALPVWYVPIGPNHAGLSMGIRLPGNLLTSIELRIAETSAAVRDTFPNAVKIFDRSIGVSVMWFGLPDLFASISPAFERRSYWQSIPLGEPNEQYLESVNRLSIGVGAGVRLSDLFAFELRHYPVVTSRRFPLSTINEKARTELRFGLLLDFEP